MRPRRTLLAAALVAVCLWLSAEAQVAIPVSQSLSPPTKTIPADATTPRERPGPPFAVVEEKRPEIPGDVAIANALGIKPVRIASPASLEGIAPRGQAFKWVLTLKGELWAIPMLDRHLVFTEKDRDIIKHDIVTPAEPVNSAGKAVLQGDVLFVDNRSGHYRPSKTSVTELAVPAFKASGFTKVEVRDNLLSD